MRSTFVGMLLVGILAGLFLLVPGAPPLPAPAARAAAPAPTEERLVQRVRKAIEDGKAYLRRQQKKGVWEIHDLGGHQYVGGTVSLAVLALLTCGVADDDKATIKDGLDYLRTIQPQMDGKGHIAAGDHSQTYVVSLQTMVYAVVDPDKNRDRIQENVDWLLDAQIPSGGWTYGKADRESVFDSSNTQYALLALHEAIRCGAKVDKRALEDIQHFYLTYQRDDPKDPNNIGSWSYLRVEIDPSMTMTTAGLCGLLITGMDLEKGHQKLDDDGADKQCGVYDENEPVAKALKWIGKRFPSGPKDPNAAWDANAYFQTTQKGKVEFSAPFYGFYGIERTGRLTGQRFINGHDWYRVGCQWLVNNQNADGSWGDGRGIDGNQLVATCFALLFMGKGRTPVLLTKLAYRGVNYDGWNNKHNDMRNVVEFASRELFKKMPLAWQIFDVRGPARQDDEKKELTQQLLESPIVFFNGHDFAPDDQEEEILKQYLENGGFVFAEACCGGAPGQKGAGFDKDFRELMKRLYPGSDLKPLDPTHPIFTASGKFTSFATDFPLEGVQAGCKTLVVYCPVAVSGYWEANQVNTEKGKKAFELAANVIAYATGLEPPRQKLDEPVIAREEKPPAIQRGYFKAAQLRHGGDWKPAPQAMHNLMVEARALGLDVILEPKDGISPTDENIVDYRFLYMHGRGAFEYKAAALDHLRFDLEENGALLFADACCGNKEFDASFRKFIEALWADRKDRPKLEPIPPDDELYSAELNGTAIDTVLCRRERADGKGPETEFKRARPALEGVKIDGRWVVIYSRYDIGCALEHHPTTDCLGHDYASAAALGKAAVLYALKR